MSPTRLSACLTALSLSLLCPLAGAAATKATPLKIATVSPLSGPLTVSGTELKRGAELSVKQHDQEFKALGYDLSLVSFDDKGSAVAAKPLAQRIAADTSILGVVGAYNSSVSNVLGEAFAASKLTIISVSTNDKLTHNGWENFNRITAPDGAQSVAAGQALIDAGISSVYVISDNTTYGNGLTRSLIEQLKASSAKVSGYNGASTDAEIAAVVRKVKASGAAAVYFGGTDDVGGRLVKALSAARVNISVMGSDGIDSPNFVRQVVGLASNISYTTVFGPVSLFSNGASFNELYKASYNVPASGVAVYAYDATEALLMGLKATVTAARAVPSRAQISAAVRQVKLPACFEVDRSKCQTVSGAVAFSKTGEREKSNVLVMKYSDMLQPQMTKLAAVNANDLK